MPYLLPTNALTLFLLLATAISSYLAFKFYLKNKNYKSGDKYLDEAKNKSYDLLHQAMKKSEVVIGEAELEGVKVLADVKVSTGKLQEQYETKINELITGMQQSLTSSDTQFKQFLLNLQVQSQEMQKDLEDSAKQRADRLFENFETRLSDFLIQTEQQSTTSIELELRSARQLIESYKTEQLKLIDENIIAMMERCLSLVLNKKLTLKDQLDLVYEALEKAKTEKFIV